MVYVAVYGTAVLINLLYWHILVFLLILLFLDVTRHASPCPASYADTNLTLNNPTAVCSQQSSTSFSPFLHITEGVEPRFSFWPDIISPIRAFLHPRLRVRHCCKYWEVGNELQFCVSSLCPMRGLFA